MSQTAQHRLDEAERLLNEPLLKQALADLEARCLSELLSDLSDKPDADRFRRERVDQINAIRAIPDALRSAMFAAKNEVRGRAGVA